MEPFDALATELNPFQSYFLEASAGTGKTFAIENLVTRLVLQEHPDTGEPLRLEEILVVTFTRAATRELRARLRSNIDRALAALYSEEVGSMPYLAAWLAPERKQLAMRRLATALSDFDEGQIFTIHSFCHRMLQEFPLKGGCPLNMPSPDRALDSGRRLEIVYDFFRTEVFPAEYSPAQVAILLGKHKGKAEALAESLAAKISSRRDIAPLEPFSALLVRFCAELKKLLPRAAVEEGQLRADFLLAVLDYNKHKAHTEEGLDRLIKVCVERTCDDDDFDFFIRSGLPTEALTGENRNKKKKALIPGTEVLSWPLFIAINDRLLPIIQKARHYPSLFARLTADCQKFSQRIFQEEELFSPDDLIHTMADRVSDPTFSPLVQAKYRVAIIDEFQDTDRLQWKIFSHLFHTPKHTLYLVGDPKQSIYSFRQADLYTYLDAKTTLGETCTAFLNTNYRAQPTLLHALNTLFSRAPAFLPLPSAGGHLPCPPVDTPMHPKYGPIHDGEKSVSFFAASAEGRGNSSWPSRDLEQHYFFPFIAREVARLSEDAGILYRDCAVLVRDRTQASALSAYLTESGIPSVMWRSRTIAESVALRGLKEVLNAALSPQDPHAVRLALAGPIIGWSESDLALLDERLAISQQILTLHHTLYERGFSAFFESLMATCWTDEGITLLEDLLQREGGSLLYDDLQQVADVLIEELSRQRLSPDHLPLVISQFALWERNGEEKASFQPNPDADAVQILTQHMSKGLEFDVVFGWGLVKRSTVSDTLITTRQSDGTLLSLPEDPKDPRYDEYQKELDAEKMRLLYVTMTRARRRLYLPIAIDMAKEPPPPGRGSAMELFLHHLGGIDRIAELCQEADISLRYLASEESPPCIEKSSPSVALVPPPAVAISGAPLSIQSFSSLSRTHHRGGGGVLPGPLALPAGAETGTIIHTLLQSLPYEKVALCTSPQDLLPLVTPKIAGTLLAGYDTATCEMVFAALHTPLFCEHPGVTISQISCHKMRHEMEFLFPVDEQFPRLEDVEVHEGFIKGFIDLFLEVDGKYYVIDWKTNWLGGTADDYSRERLSIAMQEGQYHLQAALYTEAARRYLAIFDARPFEEIYGGALYLFLRGLSPESGDKRGVYLFPLGEMREERAIGDPR